MRRLLATCSAVLVTTCSALVVGASAPADAASDRCVTRAEYAKVRQGMTVPRVKRVVGFNGTLAGRTSASQDYLIEKRRYRLCATRAKVAELGFVSVMGGPSELTRKTIVAR